MENSVQRRLAAILAADIVGYSLFMGQDEAGTLTAVQKLRAEVIEPTIAEHEGRLFKSMGDGFLAEFPSVVNAVACAVAVQKAIAARNADLPKDRAVQLRIGVNLGDVIAEGGDLFGDGVNLAARLESIALPGGIAVSSTVRDHIGNRLSLKLDDLGEQHLKNIETPTRVFVVGNGVAPIEPTKWSAADKPSIAVLPFANMSGDAEQEYFADGIVEEIITALSRFSGLFVIARNSSFTYKGRAVDVKQVGRELGVRYVLEGSVRKAADRVRITGQLIDTSTGAHLWADRFDGALADIFGLQDRVTSSVVSAIAPKLERAEIERAERKPTESLDAYDYFLRGMRGVHLWTKEANSEALTHFYRAIELDPKFASAYGMAARCYVQRRSNGWDTDRPREISETTRMASRAAEFGRDDAVALCTAGYSLSFICSDPERGAVLIARALELNPNLAMAWLFSGWAKVWLGEPETAIQHLSQAMRLSPHDPHVFNMQAGMACGHFFGGQIREAAAWAATAAHEQPRHVIGTCIAAASNALMGCLSEAETAMARLRQLDATLRISTLRERWPLRRLNDFAKLVEGLRKAGLPE